MHFETLMRTHRTSDIPKPPRIRRLTAMTAIALSLAFPSQASGDWPPGGIALCTAGVCSAIDVRVTPDELGGAFVAWGDERNDILGNRNRDVYLHRVLASGEIAPDWPSNGLPVCTNPAPQFLASSDPDGLGGVLLTWSDYRNGAGGPTGTDIYAERILADGTIAPGWPVDGAPVTQVLEAISQTAG